MLVAENLHPSDLTEVDAEAWRRRRRLDHIASVELTLRGRALGFAHALAAPTRNLADAE